MATDRNVLTIKTANELKSAFKIDGDIGAVENINCGHINDTFVVTFGSKRYLVQRVNISIFKDPVSLINNIAYVTQFIREKMKDDTIEGRCEVLHILETNGDFYYRSNDGDCYRIYDYVENSVCYQRVENENLFKESAIAFATFQKYLQDFPTEKIVDSIPDFHNTVIRFENLQKAVAEDVCGRAVLCRDAIDFAIKHKTITSKIVDGLKDGSIPTRVTHNDTKLNNVLFDAGTDKGVCVIDLDTIMQGSLLYDFGDSIRFGCNTSAEDERDLSKIKFDLKRFRAYTEGYLSVLKNDITIKEKNLLAFSGILMTFECGIRFLTDYLSGDVYFKINYPDQNLVRAKNQFRLVEEMEKHYEQAVNIVNEIYNN